MTDAGESTLRIKDPQFGEGVVRVQTPAFCRVKSLQKWSGPMILRAEQIPTEVGQDPTPFDYPSLVPQVFQVLFTVTGYLSWSYQVG